MDVIEICRVYQGSFIENTGELDLFNYRVNVPVVPHDFGKIMLLLECLIMINLYK